LFDPGITGREIERLPDEALQKARMIRHEVQDFGCRHAPPVHLASEIAIHVTRHGYSSLSVQTPQKAAARRIFVNILNLIAACPSG
jgi:hypothetical protein